VSRHGGLVAEWARDLVVIHVVAILAMGATPSLGAAVGAGQGRSASPFGKQRPVALPSHMPGLVVPNMTVQHPVCQRDLSGDPFQEGVTPSAHVP
jgi:hypothetical protein